MKAGNVLAYIALLAAAALTLRVAAGLYRRFPLQPLRHYLLSLSGFFAAGFLRIIGNYTIQELLFRQGPPQPVHATAAWVFNFLALPFFILALYAFIAMVLSFAQKQFPVAGRIAFFFLQALMFAAFAAGEIGLAGPAPGVPSPFQLAYAAAFIIDIALLVALLLLLAFAWSGKAFVDLRAFALLYAALLAGGFIGVFFLPEGPLLRIVDPAATFLLHLMPLLLLQRALIRHYRGQPVLPASSEGLESILSGCGISRREAEIVGLLLQGKSYRAIEEELFVSLKTVKSHVYNIYRKTGVNSRWQLMNLVQGARSGTKKPGEVKC